MMSYSDLKHKNLSKHPAGFFVGLEAKNHQQSTETTYCFPLRSLISEKNALYNVCFFWNNQWTFDVGRQVDP